MNSIYIPVMLLQGMQVTISRGMTLTRGKIVDDLPENLLRIEPIIIRIQGWTQGMTLGMTQDLGHQNEEWQNTRFPGKDGDLEVDLHCQEAEVIGKIANRSILP